MTNGILRSINTSIWDDPYIRKLSVQQKLIWFYLLSNRLTTMAGIYEITIDKIIFDTHIKSALVKMALDKFQHDNKIYYREDYIVMRNHLKNHHMNTNMQKGAMHIIDNLPDNVKIFLFGSVNKTPKTFNKLKSIILNKEIIIEQSTDSKEPKKLIKKWNILSLISWVKMTLRSLKSNLQRKSGIDLLINSVRNLRLDV